MEIKKEEEQEQMLITDKELLLFCNLIKLKMEYTNLQNKEEEATNRKTT